MPSHTPSPLDLPEPEREGNGLGWTCLVLAITTLFLLATNAVSLRDWIDDQPPGTIQAQAAELADRWVALTSAPGVPRALMHQQWKRAEEARFQRHSS